MEKVTPLDTIDRAYILGSITGYKYRDTSDIDINLILKPGITKDEVTKIHLGSRDFNGQLSRDGGHPINFFIKPYYAPSSWSGYTFGVYDILNDHWKKLPPEDNTGIRDPKEQFPLELMIAGMFSRRFAKYVNELYEDQIDLKQLKNTEAVRSRIEAKQNEIEGDIRRLLAEERHLHSNREWIYRRNWGTPRRSTKNIVFKLIEHGQYGGVLKALKSLRRVEKNI